MSDPVAKAERSKFKDARQQPAPEPARIPSKKKRQAKKPWHVIGPSYFGGEFVWHKATTRERAEAWIEKQQRSYAYARSEKFRVEYKE